MITLDDVEEHEDAQKWEDELPQIGSALSEGGVVLRAKCVSAFWFVKNIIIPKKIFSSSILIKQHSKTPTVLYFIEIAQNK